MKIGLDVDGVLADSMPIVNDFYNRRFGSNFKLFDYQYYDLEKTWGGTKQNAAKIIEYLFFSPYWNLVPPVDYSQEGIDIISKENNLIAITSRPISIHEKTQRFIKEYFGDKIREIVSTGQYASLATNISKSDICISRGIELLIEDCFEVALDCAQKGISVFLLDYPWNQLNGFSANSLPDNFHRVSNWKEIMEKLT